MSTTAIVLFSLAGICFAIGAICKIITECKRPPLGPSIYLARNGDPDARYKARWYFEHEYGIPPHVWDGSKAEIKRWLAAKGLMR